MELIRISISIICWDFNKRTVGVIFPASDRVTPSCMRCTWDCATATGVCVYVCVWGGGDIITWKNWWNIQEWGWKHIYKYASIIMQFRQPNINSGDSPPIYQYWAGAVKRQYIVNSSKDAYRIDTHIVYNTHTHATLENKFKKEEEELLYSSQKWWIDPSKTTGSSSCFSF
jgi:hypothetical protein